MPEPSTAAKRAMRLAKSAGSLQKMRGVVLTLTGDKRLDKTLARVRGSVARKAMRGAIGKATRLIAKSIKAQVPVDMKQAKPLIGTAVGTAKGGNERDQFAAKAGAGVGKAFKKVAKRKAGKRQGVGIAGRNIHWFVMGTGQRRNKRGSTGQMPPQMPEIVQRGFNAAASEAKSLVMREVKQKLAEIRAKK